MKHSVPRCGYVALVGKTNSGKSTLLNAIVARKISATTSRPQTTRSLIYGVVTQDNRQAIYIDTPGVDKQYSNLNRLMHRQMLQALGEVQLAIAVIDAHRYDERDFRFFKSLTIYEIPLVVALNKIDLIANKDSLLPLAERVQQETKKNGLELKNIFPISASKRQGLSPLKNCIMELLPEATLAYDDNQVILNSDRFFACEFLREQLFRHLGQELPFSLGVICESMDRKSILFISLSILITKKSHKAIILGTRGEKIKRMASRARKEMEHFFATKIMLSVRVKLDKNWSHNLLKVREVLLDNNKASPLPITTDTPIMKI